MLPFTECCLTDWLQESTPPTHAWTSPYQSFISSSYPYPRSLDSKPLTPIQKSTLPIFKVVPTMCNHKDYRITGSLLFIVFGYLHWHTFIAKTQSSQVLVSRVCDDTEHKDLAWHRYCTKVLLLLPFYSTLHSVQKQPMKLSADSVLADTADTLSSLFFT